MPDVRKSITDFIRREKDRHHALDLAGDLPVPAWITLADIADAIEAEHDTRDPAPL